MDKVVILSANEYFQKYGVDGIGKGADKWMIRRQLIDAFHKEIFGLVTLRTEGKGFQEENNPEAIKIARNVIKDTTRKWVKLCKMFSMYVQTKDLIHPNDLKLEEEMGIDHNGKPIVEVDEDESSVQ